MYTQENHSTEDYSPNGGGREEVSRQKEYAPEDFSQQAINRGQREINYELTVVGQKAADALKALRDAIARAPGGDKIDFDAVDEAISDVYKTSNEVAKIIPPGCLGRSGEPQESPKLIND